MPPDPDATTFSRRTFLAGASATAFAGSLAGSAAAARRTGRPGGETFAAGEHEIELRVNGTTRTVKVEPRTTLLDALRDRMDMTGSKKVCDRGSCGGCTVLVDGEAANSCMMLALDAEGLEVTTIEGLSQPSSTDPGALEELHPLQRAFVEREALQCGFCTPGMVMAAAACLQRHDKPTPAQIRHEMSGNVCRCGTYPRVFEAVAEAASQAPGGGR